MSQYCYGPSALGCDSIRLLRLMPNEDETAPIHCQLFNYPLHRLDKGTHLYEALSYVWGDPCNTLPIFVEEHSFPVTVNLHAALSRLRDHFLQRIVWVDSICINQADGEEKRGQIQSMAKIYGQANRVIVWLGDAADDSDRAVEEIRIAAGKQFGKQSTDFSTDETLQQAIRALLRRPWFRRIWVLQEIAAARHVRVMCGSLEIGGYAFCSGLESLKHFYETLPELRSLIHSVVYLMEGAIFRPDYRTSLSDRVSLEICPLGELIEMFHTREATLLHDKVYALLGMSSDNTNAAGLSPDYTVPWSQLFQRLVKFLLCQQVSVETWEDREIAVIKSRGCVIGQVSSIENDQEDRQNLNIIFRSALEHLGYNKEWKVHRTLRASAKSVQEGDLVCLLQGTSKPTIIRPYKDYFAVIMIAATPSEAVRTESSSVRQPKLSQSRIDPPYDFLLVWSWETAPGQLQSRGECKTLTEVLGRENTTIGLEDDLGKATRLWKAALILQDSKEYEEAKRRLKEAIKGCERTIGKKDLHTLVVMETLALVYRKTKEWKEAEELLLQVIKTKQRMRMADHPDTLISMASLALCYKAQGQLMGAEKQEMMICLLKLRGIQIEEELVVQVARSFDEEVMTLLFQQKGDEIQVTEEMVEAAAGNEGSGQQAMKLLFDCEGDEIQITEGVVKAAAGNRRSGQEVMKVLLDREGDKIQITEGVVKAAAGNGRSGQEVMKLLLNHEGNKIQITEGAVVEVARRRFDEEVMKLLLDRKGDEIHITEGVVEAAAGNWRSAQKVMQLLLDRREDEIQTTEAVVEAAAGNKGRGKRSDGASG
ncbi:HET-domain-containing protein [Setomelanomma holmii]|uniref:HET-domain-containing protein n=1 Tax=Setomelanomma holmii TaxID=210430 RepID=A0A9P4LFV6_9PLEO|nr:HET-domain-containing protein [Setomelanomma holmii]